MLATTTTDWITAISGVFAAVGTVGAVVVALRQVLRQERRSVKLEARYAIIPDLPESEVLSLRATNDGVRAVTLNMAYLMTNDGRQVMSPFTMYSTSLPTLLQDGESATVFWKRSNLDALKESESVAGYTHAFFMDNLGEVYETPLPGVSIKRRGVRRRRTYVLPDPASPGRVTQVS
jgi:hypothetical protein